MAGGFHKQYGARRLNYAVDKVIGSTLADLKMNSNWDDLKRIKIELDPYKKAIAEGIEFNPDAIYPEQGDFEC